MFWRILFREVGVDQEKNQTTDGKWRIKQKSKIVLNVYNDLFSIIKYNEI